LKTSPDVKAEQIQCKITRNADDLKYDNHDPKNQKKFGQALQTEKKLIEKVLFRLHSVIIHSDRPRIIATIILYPTGEHRQSPEKNED
jgi:hypothetical protein